MIQKQLISPNSQITIKVELSDQQIENIAVAVAEKLKHRENYDHSIKEILTPKEVEGLLDISHTTRIEWTSKGLLKSYTIAGRKIHYKRSEIINSLIKIEK